MKQEEKIEVVKELVENARIIHLALLEELGPNDEMIYEVKFLYPNVMQPKHPKQVDNE